MSLLPPLHPRPLLLAVPLVFGSACSSVPLIPNDGVDQTLELPEATDPVPAPDSEIEFDEEADWLELASGEWLRGKLIRLRDGDLVFDSDQLGELVLSLSDVRTARTAAAEVVVTEDGKVLQGKLVLGEDELWIEGARTVQIPRESLLATMALRDGTTADWTGRTTIGFVTRSGNTNQTDATAQAEVIRQTARTRWRNLYNGTLTRAGGSEISNNHRARSIYDVFLTRRLFVTAASLELYRDRFQNIDLRVTPGAGLGYQILNGPAREWKVTLGPAFQYTRFDEPAPGIGQDDSTLAVVALSQFAWDLTSRIDLGFDYGITSALPETKNYNHNLVLRLSVDLIEDFTLDVAFVWDRVNEPVPAASGSVPEQDDYRITVGLGWNF